MRNRFTALLEGIPLVVLLRRTAALACLLSLAALMAACGSATRDSKANPSLPVQGDGSAATTTDLDPPFPPPSTGCYYVWATRELPDLTETVQQALGHVDSTIRASAYAFGEECRGDDGTLSFLPMEADFRVQVPVTKLDDAATLGAWIARVMPVVESVPVQEMPGARPGRVEFEFYVDGSTSLRLMVDISRYRSDAGGLDGAAMFELFRADP